MLQDPVVLEYLQHGEANPEHNLFTSVAVIHSFATKCRNREVRRFVLGALVDAVRLGIMEKPRSRQGHWRHPIPTNTGTLSFTR